MKTARAAGLNADEAEDVGGETIAAIIRKGLPVGANAAAYTRAAAAREAGRAIGRKRRQRDRETSALPDDVLGSAPPEPTARAATAHAIEALTAELATLSAQDRAILALAAAGLRSALIAEALAITPEVVRKRLQRARDRHEVARIHSKLDAVADAVAALDPEDRAAALSAVGITCAQAGAILGRIVASSLPTSRRRVTPEISEEIERMHAAGASGYEIAKRLKLHRGSVAWALRQARRRARSQSPG